MVYRAKVNDLAIFINGLGEGIIKSVLFDNLTTILVDVLKILIKLIMSEWVKFIKLSPLLRES